MKHLILAPLLLFPLYSFAMPISEMVQKSVQTHPQIQIVKESLYVERENLTQVQAGWMPTLDASYKVGPERTKTPANQRERADLTRQEAGITLVQNVFRGFDTVSGTDQQKALILSAQEGVAEAANKLAVEATSAYLEVMKTYELYQIAKENVEVHEKYLNQIKKKVDAGVQRASDYEQTLSRLENARSLSYLSEQNYENAIYSFKRILPEDVTGSDLSKPTVGTLPASDLATLVEMAIENNPTVKVSDADIIAAKAAVERSKAPYYPTADIVAEAHWNDEVNGVGHNNNINGIGGNNYSESEGYSALLVLNYNLFNGFSDSAAKQANQHRLLRQQSTLADAKRFIAANTSIAWRTYTLTEKQIEHLNKNVAASKETVKDYQKENDLGRRSIIDLLNIELEYNSARNRQTTAQYDRLVAYYQILANTGKLLEEMDIEVE